MELHQPFKLITPTVDGDVLAALARAEAWFTPPQLHRVVRRHSESGIRQALERLSEQGLVRRARAGRAYLYELNRDHLAAPHVTAIARLFDEFVTRAAEHFGTWQPPCEYAALFGSAATGGMRPSSDLDIFIVRPDHVGEDDPTWGDQMVTLIRTFTAWTGNDARPLEWSASEMRSAMREGEPVLRDIVRDGIRLWGPSGYLRQVA